MKCPWVHRRRGCAVYPTDFADHPDATLITVILPFVGLVVALIVLWGRGLGWVELSLLLTMYLLTGLGVTIGFHRLFTHHSFETNGVVQFILGVLGSMAVQGPLFKWVAIHRRHHQNSDQDSVIRIRHPIIAEASWVCYAAWEPPDLSRYLKDLRQSKLLRTISALFPVWVLVGLLIPTGLGWLLIGEWLGALVGLLWGGLVRIFFVQHVTWSINSVCHLWGRQPFNVRDHSKNNFVCGILSFGEGWHNNHHAFPTSARHGFKW